MGECAGHKLLVGDLPHDISTEELQLVFQTYGAINAIHIPESSVSDDAATRSACVTYADREGAEDAITVLDGIYRIREHADHPIKVCWAGDENLSCASDTEPAQSEQPPIETEPASQPISADAAGFKIFVGGLAADVNEDELRMVFGTYGEVTKVHMIRGNSTRLAAFVYYDSSQAADDAIAVLHEKYKIRQDADATIVVRWANQERERDRSGGAGGSAVRSADGWKLFVGGLPADTSENELRTIFSTYGEVAKVYIMQPNVMGKVAAFVFYVEEQCAADAIKVLNNVYKIRTDAQEAIQVRWADQASAKINAPPSKDTPWGASQWNSWDKDKESKPWQQAPQWSASPWNSRGSDQHKPNWGNNWQESSPTSRSGCSNWNGSPWENKSGQSSRQTGWNGAAGNWSGGDGGKTEGPPSETKLFVGNLPDDVSEEALAYVFTTYGKVRTIQIMRGRSKSGSACAFVELSDGAEAETAILTLHNSYEIKPGSGKIVVNRAKTRTRPY